jgi:Ca2+-binding RTX toxin-like protein
MSSEITLASGSATALTALANGTFLTVWNGAGNVPTAQIYNFDGTKRGGPITLASGSIAENLNFTATSLNDGRFVVAWQQKGAKDGIYARIFDVNGTPAGDAFKIASDPVSQTLSQVIALDDGGFAITSINEGTATIVRVAADGSQAMPFAFQSNASGIGVAKLQNGDFVAFVDVTGPNGHDMVTHIFAADGSTFPAGEVFSDILDDPLSPHVAVLSDGGFVLVWDGIDNGGNDSIIIHQYDSTGQVLDSGVGILFSEGPGYTLGSPAVKALPGGGFVFAYMQEGGGGKDVYVGHSRTNSPSFLLARRTGEDFFTSSDQEAPEIAVLSDGRYVVSWVNTVGSGTETRAEIFDPREMGVNWVGTALSEQYQGTIYDDILSGGGGDDLIVSDRGTDILNGGSGQDTLEGGNDSDTYYVDSSGDRVMESFAGGTVDRVYAAVSHTLASYVEQLYGSGSGSINLTGNSLANAIYGNSGVNRINGSSGKDSLTGGTGKDTFIFNTKLSPNNVDKILDFSVRDDTIWLDNAIFKKLGSGSVSTPKKLSSSYFVSSSKAKDKNDYIVYDKTKGYLYYDADGSGSGKAVLVATLSKNLKMTFADFYVI